MRVTVTGGRGFLGRHVVQALQDHGHEVFDFPSTEYDLRDNHACARLMLDSDPDAIVHLAARVGGIGDNVQAPGTFLYENALMGLQLMELARVYGVEKFLTVGTACMYPDDVEVPTREDDLWNGYPAADTAPYGIAKRLLLSQGQAYREQHDFRAIMVIPSNLYGPGDQTTHVVPQMVEKFSTAMYEEEETITLWGTGGATRDFLYVEDAASGITQALDYYDDPEPMNLGTGVEVPIFLVAKLIRSIYGWEGDIQWDPTRPEGAKRRCLDVSRAGAKMGWYAQTNLPEGMRRFVDWYEGVQDE